MTNILTFNTKRQYSEHGQRIAAVRHNARVYFYDVDRGVYGLTNKDIDLTQSAIMIAYDYNDYRSEYLHDLLDVLRKAADAM